MKNYIIGCGGFSKEVFFVAKRNGIKIDGFIDIVKKNIKIGDKEFESIEEKEILLFDKKETNFYIGLGSPKTIKNIKYKYHDFNFPNLIDPEAKLIGNVSLGRGNIICCNSVLTTDIKIGSFNILNISCTVGHDVKIGDCNVINPTCCISGNVEIEDNNLFGVNSTILEKIKICSNNIIGGSSIILRNIEEEGVYVGIPAKRKI